MEQEIMLAKTERPPSAAATAPIGTDRVAFAWSADGAIFVTVAGIEALQLSETFTVPRPGGAPVPETPGAKTFWPRTARASLDAEDLGLLASPDGNLLLTALERPTHGSGGAFAALLSATGEPIRTLRLGPAGEYATKITAVRLPDSYLVAWHDGALDGSRIHLVLLDEGVSAINARASFGGDSAVSGAAAATMDDIPLLAWAETGSRGGDPYSRIRTARVARDLSLTDIRTVAEGRFFYPDPQLVSHPEGGNPGLIYRDDDDKDRTPEYYFIPLGPTGAPAGERRRISQADGLKGPSLAKNGDYYFGAAVRSFQRNLLIGVNRFDGQGVKQNGEFQVYADKSDFVRVDIAPAGDAVIIVYAEDKRTEGRVSAGRVFCGDRP